jgi:hypothetical protein
LFTFVISLVLVGAVLFFATRIAIGPAPAPDKPATPLAGGVVASKGSAAADAAWGPLRDDEREPVQRRLRSGALLLAILTTLGAIVALILVICVAVVLSGLRSAV